MGLERQGFTATAFPDEAAPLVEVGKDIQTLIQLESELIDRPGMATDEARLKVIKARWRL